MSYKPEVVHAAVVSHNPKSGLYEIVATLKNRDHCRLTCQEDTTTHETSVLTITRTTKVPCGVCLRDTQCQCMTTYKEEIFQQAEAILR